MTTHRILILGGGGFGGVYAARRLDQIFAHREDVEIIHLRICGIEGTGFFFPEWRGGGKECLNVYGSTEPRRRHAS